MSEESFRFDHKHAFITGGSNGIGLAIAKLLLKRGASVSFSDIADPAVAIKSLNDLITSQGLPGNIHFVKADVSKFDQMVSAIKEVEEKLGPIDCLVPNAGVASGGLFLDERIEDLERVNRVNFMGVIYTLKAGLPGMVARGSGRVLMMSSMMAMYAGFCSSAYVAPKAGVLSLANALRLELLGTGVGITIAMPAFTDTAMRTVGLENDRSPDFAKQLTKEMKVYTPEEVAELAIQGVEKGLFFSKSPDLISNIAIGSMAGVAPKIFNVFVEFLLLPLYFFLHLWMRWNIDKRILTWRNEERAKKAAGAGSNNGKSSKVEVTANSATGGRQAAETGKKAK